MDPTLQDVVLAIATDGDTVICPGSAEGRAASKVLHDAPVIDLQKCYSALPETTKEALSYKTLMTLRRRIQLRVRSREHRSTASNKKRKLATDDTTHDFMLERHYSSAARLCIPLPPQDKIVSLFLDSL